MGEKDAKGRGVVFVHLPQIEESDVIIYTSDASKFHVKDDDQHRRQTKYSNKRKRALKAGRQPESSFPPPSLHESGWRASQRALNVLTDSQLKCLVERASMNGSLVSRHLSKS